MEDVVVIDRDFWRGRRVLVTGHTGFKGSWLTLWLANLGADVVGLALAPVGRSLFVEADVARDCESHLVDVRDAGAVRRLVVDAKADVVFHLAAQALVRPSYASAVETWMTNVMGTIHLLEALRQSGSCGAVVVVTSDKCYEQDGDARAFTESDPLGGHDPYSSSKAAAEIAVASWRRSFLATKGIGVATARAGNVIGGGDWASDRLIPDLAAAALDHREVRIRSPHATRPWQHVLDPLSGYLLLAQRLRSEPARYAGAWNFGPDGSASTTVHAVAALFSKGLQDTVTYRCDENRTLYEAAALSLSIEKARSQLGWRPRLAIEEAIRFTVEGYRAALQGGDQRAVILDQIERYSHDTVSPARHEAVS